jgi:ribosome-binding factor A
MARRKERVNELIRDVLSELIRREVKDPRLGMVSVTGVEVAPDLSSAKVFVSVIGDEEQQKESIAILQRAKGFLRSELAHQVRSLRHIPELIIKEDNSLKTGARVFELLEQVKREEAAHSSAEEDTEDADQAAPAPQRHSG